MIRGGFRVAVQHGKWDLNVKNAVRELLAAQKVDRCEGSWPEGIHKQLADTTDSTVLGSLTGLSQHQDLGRCLVAQCDIPKDTIVMPVDGIVMPKPNTWTIQVSEDDHLLSVGGSQLAAHSCDPSMFLLFDQNSTRLYPGSSNRLDTLYFCSKRDIAKGEQLTFDYNTSEWAIVDTFKDAYSGRDITGFSKINDPVYRMSILPYLTPPMVALARKHGLLSKHEEDIAGVLCRTL
eukprot:TRINITY_DN303_c2_g1_i1.p1 TRINITY_DN303_c2_g1~~TRINITY_DN303_c2_g1_i1.p1  ORF type:complete len:245 (+),score=59.71 TRINITY_DN303_c2_g1_i1:35-736(+)